MPYSVDVMWDDPVDLNGPIAFYRVEIEGGNKGPLVNDSKC